ncbi:MAG: ABC transporter substrate-binding protein [Bernardetiaceae bacterium]
MRLRLPLIVSLLWLTACQEAPQEQAEAVFTYAEASLVRSLDPMRAETRGERWLAAQLFNTAFEVGEDLNLYPALVERYGWASDGRACTLTVREQVPFHAPLTRYVRASDVVFSWRRALAARSDLPLGRWLEASSITALDHRRLLLQLDAPFADLLWLLSDVRLSVVLPEAVSEKGSRFGVAPIGTGPFYLVHWYKDHSARLSKHPAYFRQNFRGYPLPYLDGVYVSFLDDPSEIQARFADNQLDLCWDVLPDSSLATYAFTHDLLAGYFLWLPTDSPRVFVPRQHLAQKTGKPVLLRAYPGFLPQNQQQTPLRTAYDAAVYAPDSLRLYATAQAASIADTICRYASWIRAQDSSTADAQVRYRQIPFPRQVFWDNADTTGRWIPLLLERKKGLVHPRVRGLHLDATETLRLEQVELTH